MIQKNYADAMTLSVFRYKIELRVLYNLVQKVENFQIDKFPFA